MTEQAARPMAVLAMPAKAANDRAGGEADGGVGDAREGGE